MPYDQVYIVKARGIFNLKADLRLKLAAPGVAGDHDILFKNIYRSTGRNNEEAGNEEGQGQNMKLAVPFQWKYFYKYKHQSKRRKTWTQMASSESQLLATCPAL